MGTCKEFWCDLQQSSSPHTAINCKDCASFIANLIFMYSLINITPNMCRRPSELYENGLNCRMGGVQVHISSKMAKWVGKNWTISQVFVSSVWRINIVLESFKPKTYFLFAARWACFLCKRAKDLLLTWTKHTRFIVRDEIWKRQ